jgi:hypothetical protein
MSTIATKKRSKFGKLDRTIKDHSNDPFVVKKAKSAKKFMVNLALPKLKS